MNFGKDFLLTKSNLTGENIFQDSKSYPLKYFLNFSETEEEKKVRESIQVWYGINNSAAYLCSFSILVSSIVLHLLSY